MRAAAPSTGAAFFRFFFASWPSGRAGRAGDGPRRRPDGVSRPACAPRRVRQRPRRHEAGAVDAALRSRVARRGVLARAVVADRFGLRLRRVEFGLRRGLGRLVRVVGRVVARAALAELEAVATLLLHLLDAVGLRDRDVVALLRDVLDRVLALLVDAVDAVGAGHVGVVRLVGHFFVRVLDRVRELAFLVGDLVGGLRGFLAHVLGDLLRALGGLARRERER